MRQSKQKPFIIPVFTSVCLRTDTIYPPSFSQCAGSPRKLRFKFKPRSYMPYIPDEYVACVCGCDQDFLDTLDIRAVTAVGPQASQGRLVSRLALVWFWDGCLIKDSESLLFLRLAVNFKLEGWFFIVYEYRTKCTEEHHFLEITALDLERNCKFYYYYYTKTVKKSKKDKLHFWKCKLYFFLLF